MGRVVTARSKRKTMTLHCACGRPLRRFEFVEMGQRDPRPNRNGEWIDMSVWRLSVRQPKGAMGQDHWTEPGTKRTVWAFQCHGDRCRRRYMVSADKLEQALIQRSAAGLTRLELGVDI
jgi:hypothetical protein